MTMAQKKNEAFLQMVKEFKKVFSEMAEEQYTAGKVKRFGVVEFNYDQVIEMSNGCFKSRSFISVGLKTLESIGKIKQIARGTIGRLSIWDVTDLIEATTPARPKAPEAEIEILSVEEEPVFTAAVEPVVEIVAAPVSEENSSEEAIQTLNNTIQDMTDFLRKMPGEMIGTLMDLSKKIKYEDKEKVEELQTKLNRVRQELLDTLERVTGLETTNSKLIAEIKEAKDRIVFLENEAVAANESKWNLHVLYRHRNGIMDELERYIATPTWKKTNKADHIRHEIQKRLDFILEEVGITENQKQEA